jgi:cell wall-associated NlpC family hydrolase
MRDAALLSYSDLVGKPYLKGASGPDAFDCYGLVRELARRMGVSVPDYTKPSTWHEIADCIERERTFWTPCEEGAGAVALFRIRHLVDGKPVTLATHVGMCIGHGRFVHAWKPAGGVVREDIQPWRRRIVGFYSFPQ